MTRFLATDLLPAAPGEAPSRRAVLVTAKTLAAELQADRPPVILVVRSDDTTAPRPFDTHDRIPGAIETDLALDFADPSNLRLGSRPLPALHRLEERVRAWGIDPDTAIVVYDHDGNLQAARAWWVLRWAGLSKVRMLDGGFPAWARATLPVTRVLPDLARAGTATLTGGHMPELDAAGSAALARRGVLLDSRIAPNYVGADIAPGEAPRGHIPGAVNIPAPRNLDDDGRFASLTALREIYDTAGVFDGSDVGVYCGAGVSAAHDVAALAMLGIDAAMYPGSWSAWIGDPQHPVARGREPG